MKKRNLISAVLLAIALFLQCYFIVETVRLYACGYVMYMGEPIETEWFSLLFTLLVVIACESVSFLEAILFLAFNRTKFAKIYMALVIGNALCFMTMAYYSVVGTTVCLSVYAVLFVLRILRLARSVLAVLNDRGLPEGRRKKQK